MNLGGLKAFLGGGGKKIFGALRSEFTPPWDFPSYAPDIDLKYFVQVDLSRVYVWSVYSVMKFKVLFTSKIDHEVGRKS